jgi:hypothetical protein
LPRENLCSFDHRAGGVRPTQIYSQNLHCREFVDQEKNPPSRARSAPFRGLPLVEVNPGEVSGFGSAAGSFIRQQL